MEKSNFDKLLERYLHGQVTEEEKNKIEAWLELKNTKQGKNFIWSEKDEELLFKKITNRIEDADEVVKFYQELDAKKPFFISVRYAVAASIFLVCLVTGVIWSTIHSKSKDYFHLSSEGFARKAVLEDGSIVWLKPGSDITYHVNHETGERDAEFNGAALFEIAKDPKHPFIISSGLIKAKVLGTSFSLSTKRDGVVLKVLTGKVNLSSALDEIGVNVMPYENVKYITTGIIERANLNEDEAKKIVAGTEYDLKFKNTTMDQVFLKIEKKFDTKLSIDDQQLTHCRITADLTDRSLSDTFRMLSELLDLEYNIRGKTISVKGRGCN